MLTPAHRMPELNERELTGRARSHVLDLVDPPVVLHRDVVEPFLALRAAAVNDGFDLVAMSGFRDFDRQAAIWNEKLLGQRPLYDRDGRRVRHEALSPEELVDAVLAWSALPGASRHHWGTEIDVYDRRAALDGQRVDMLASEYGGGGRFEQLTSWLDERMTTFGWFRPYDLDRGGVQPEPWHLSYAPLAEPALAAMSVDVVAAALEHADLDGVELVLARLPEIVDRYVFNVARFTPGGHLDHSA